MVKAAAPYDVFVSYNRRDADLARQIAQTMQSYGLNVFTDADLESGKRNENTLWEAIAESQAFIAVIPETQPSASIVLELGAAKAWDMPIYAILADPSSTRLPTSLRGLLVHSPSRIEGIAQKIKQSLASLTDSEAAVLIDEYERIGVPVDRLSLQPEDLSMLSDQFKRRTSRQMAPEQLLRMLLRLRKQGALQDAKMKKRPS
jgi:hypothetical protein